MNTQTAHALVGDLDGDGTVSPSDDALLQGFYGAVEGTDQYDQAADLNDDGKVDVRDIAILGERIGATAQPDTNAPAVLLTVNDIPDDMNDLIVVPPDGFQITILYDSGGGSVIDPDSLVFYTLNDFGPFPGGTNLADQFTVGASRAVWDVPAGTSIDPTGHVLISWIGDVAGNRRMTVYGIASRDFVLGPPMGNLQTIFLDFDQDRSLGSEVDFVEDLREFGLSSPSDPVLEQTMRTEIIGEILRRIRVYYGYNDDGTPGPDPVNIQFTSTEPLVPHSRMCVGGESTQGPLFLGASTTDINNSVEVTDECAITAYFGVFPQAIDDLWSGDPDYQAAFAAVDPDLGGIPAGEHPLDATVLDVSFDPLTAGVAEYTRWINVLTAIDAFAQAVATATAHEVGHMLGLTAPGAAPAGLYGGTSGSKLEHNVTPLGGSPVGNHIMNRGSDFTFAELTGRGTPHPTFRPLNWAYLHDRIALNNQVHGLYLAPVIDSVSPSPAVYGGGSLIPISIEGEFFSPPVTVRLWDDGPIPYPVLSPTVSADGTTIDATLYDLFVAPGVYDVEVEITDGQSVTLPGALEVQP